MNGGFPLCIACENWEEGATLKVLFKIRGRHGQGHRLRPTFTSAWLEALNCER